MNKKQNNKSKPKQTQENHYNDNKNKIRDKLDHTDIESTWIQRTFGGSIGMFFCFSLLLLSLLFCLSFSSSEHFLGPKGDVITTYTQIGPFAWHYIFGAQLTASYDFLTSDLLLPFTGKYVAFLFNASDDTYVTLSSSLSYFFLFISFYLFHFINLFLVKSTWSILEKVHLLRLILGLPLVMRTIGLLLPCWTMAGCIKQKKEPRGREEVKVEGERNEE